MPQAPKLRRPLVLASVMAAMFMIAIEATIVSTAMPGIAGQLATCTCTPGCSPPSC